MQQSAPALAASCAVIVTSNAASRPGTAAFVKISAGRAVEASTNPRTSVVNEGSARRNPSAKARTTP
eukprot:7685844-Karenia_brevis.AAC.1